MNQPRRVGLQRAERCCWWTCFGYRSCWQSWQAVQHTPLAKECLSGACRARVLEEPAVDALPDWSGWLPDRGLLGHRLPEGREAAGRRPKPPPGRGRARPGLAPLASWPFAATSVAAPGLDESRAGLT